MRKSIISLVLIAAGVMLAFNIGKLDSRLSMATVRNPAIIEVSNWFREYSPERLVQFEQDVLAYLPLAPYFFLGGVGAGILLNLEKARLGALIPLSYALCFGTQLFFVISGSQTLGWLFVVDTVIWHLSHVSIYLVGVGIGRCLVEHRLPAWSTLDLLLLMTYASMLLGAILYRPFYAVIPTILFISFSYLAYRLTKQSRVIS